MPDTKQAIKVLRDELALQTRHCKLLEAQEQALLSCDRARFIELQSQHAQMLLHLETQDSARRAVLQDDIGSALTLSALKATVSAGSMPTLVSLEDGLRRTLDRVQTLTLRNKTLIQNELNYLAFTLDLFVEAGRSADQGYGPHRSSQGQRLGRLMLDRRV